jgi:hypothetical protein
MFNKRKASSDNCFATLYKATPVSGYSYESRPTRTAINSIYLTAEAHKTRNILVSIELSLAGEPPVQWVPGLSQR